MKNVTIKASNNITIMITKKKAIEQASKSSEPVSLKDALKAKNKKTKSQKVALKSNCPNCNRYYKKQDSLEKHLKTCNGKIGGGMPKGHVSERTKLIRDKKLLMQERITENVDKLLNAQLNLALGQTMLFVKITERDGKGNAKRSYHERVESEETIKQYLDDPNYLNDDEHYYYITTRPGNNQAITNLLDRAFGKPKENIEVGEDPEAPVGKHGTGTTTELRKAFVDLVKSTVREQKK